MFLRWLSPPPCTVASILMFLLFFLNESKLFEQIRGVSVFSLVSVLAEIAVGKDQLVLVLVSSSPLSPQLYSKKVI